MSYIERTVADGKGVTRRSAIKGGIVAAVAVFFAVAVPTFAVTTYKKLRNYIAGRTANLYAIDAASDIRVSHLNPDVLRIYEEFLSPGTVNPSATELSHRLCHTVYGADVEEHIAELKATPLSHVIAEVGAGHVEEA